MNKQEIFDLMNSNPACFMATLEGDQPRVRGMLLYKADEAGIIFHTGIMKDLYKQVVEHPKVELCFVDFNKHVQVRVEGSMEIIDDNKLKDEIAQHPSREFLKAWRESGSLEDFYKTFAVFRLKNGTATIWTMERNFAYPKEEIRL